MTYAAYTRLYFVLLGLGLSLTFLGILTSLVLSLRGEEIAEVTGMIGVTLFAVGFATNATCGLHHKRFQIRSWVSSRDTRGAWFWLDVAMIYILAGACFYLSALLWRAFLR